MTSCAYCGDTVDIENGLCSAHVSELWLNLCRLDADKSNAFYTPWGSLSDRNSFCRWLFTARKAQSFRKPLAFWGRGYGWRLRKNPHWQKTFSEIYPSTWRLIKEGEGKMKRAGPGTRTRDILLGNNALIAVHSRNHPDRET